VESPVHSPHPGPEPYCFGKTLRAPPPPLASYDLYLLEPRWSFLQYEVPPFLCPCSPRWSHNAMLSTQAWDWRSSLDQHWTMELSTHTFSPRACSSSRTEPSLARKGPERVPREAWSSSDGERSLGSFQSLGSVADNE